MRFGSSAERQPTWRLYSRLVLVLRALIIGDFVGPRRKWRANCCSQWSTQPVDLILALLALLPLRTMVTALLDPVLVSSCAWGGPPLKRILVLIGVQPARGRWTGQQAIRTPSPAARYRSAH